MPHFNSSLSTLVKTAGLRALDVLLLMLLAWFLMDRFDFSLLVEPTIMTGGDSASWYQIALFMKQELIPHGQLMGWDQDNFLGYPELQYYFIFPFLLTVLLSYLIPLTVALKIVSAIGLIALPFAVYWALNFMSYRRPTPMIGAWLSLIFLFHERFNMFGGNALSNLAGEFSYSLAFLLQVIFMATLVRGQRSNRLMVINGILLAVIGLTHAFVFLTAVFMPAYFLLNKESCKGSAKWVIKIYLLAFLLMAFWTFPMLAQLGYTTPVRMIWTFQSFANLLSMLNYEILIAGAAALLVSISMPHRHSQWKFFIFIVAISIAMYFTATLLEIPDIRFFPPLLFFCLMLVTDASQSLLRRLENRMLPTAALLLLAVLAGGSWLYQSDNDAPGWWHWNMSGYETKQAFKDGSMDKLAEILKADKLSPRVAWEKSNYNPGFGSDRVFESLPLFTGRKTLEGIHYSSALLSKPLSWLLGEYSLTAASPEALVYAHYNVDVLPERFEMLNISEIIIRSAEMKSLLQESPRFTRIGDANELSVFKITDEPKGYVSTPRFRPQLTDLNKNNWRNAYYSWFQRQENLSHAIVSSHFTTPDSRSLFPDNWVNIDVRGKMEQVDSIAVKPAKVTVQQLDNHEIKFQTDSPGEPHIIKVAYSPNWHSESGETIFPISPGLMLVYPEGDTVRLQYRRGTAALLGIIFTLSGLLLVSISVVRKISGKPAWTPSFIDATARLVNTNRRIIIVVLASVLCLMAIQSLRIKQQITGDYGDGIQLKSRGEYIKAEQAFLRASSDAQINQHPQGPDIPHAMTALAWLYTEQGEDQLAMQQYQRILRHYPGWIFIHQIYDGVAQLNERNGRIPEAIAAFAECARIDRFSVAGKRCTLKFQELTSNSTKEQAQ